MRIALDLAERGRLTARPNPMVGAVVVKSGRIVGSGYHERPGEGHAEVNALADVPDDVAQDATIYVTLEPCSFVGRTPACSDLLIDKKVGRVVCAMEDPDGRVAGSGFARLRAAGVYVSVGLLAEYAERLNATYLVQRRQGRPYVTLKLAQSLDGSIATRSGDSRWITGSQARKRGHALRTEALGIAIGIGTVLADDPTLNVRHVVGSDPIKVVFDSRLQTPLGARVLQGERCVICASESPDPDRVNALRDRGADVWLLPGDRPKAGDVLERLSEEGLIHLLVEGGSQLAASFLSAGLVDRIVAFTAPKLIGGMASVSDLGLGQVEKSIILENVVIETVGSDLMYTADVR